MASPIGPAPTISTVSSGWSGLRLTACHATERGSTRAIDCQSGDAHRRIDLPPISSGIDSGRRIACFSPTTTRSDKPPALPELYQHRDYAKAEDDKMTKDIPLYPMKPILSQQLFLPIKHLRHVSSLRLGLTATLSPILSPVTPSPTSSTVPLNSWPRVVGSFSPVRGCGWTGTV